MLIRCRFLTCVCQALRYRRASSAACSSLPCLISTRMRLAGSFCDPAMPLLASCTCTGQRTNTGEYMPHQRHSLACKTVQLPYTSMALQAYTHALEGVKGSASPSHLKRLQQPGWQCHVPVRCQKCIDSCHSQHAPIDPADWACNVSPQVLPCMRSVAAMGACADMRGLRR